MAVEPQTQNPRRRVNRWAASGRRPAATIARAARVVTSSGTPASRKALAAAATTAGAARPRERAPQRPARQAPARAARPIPARPARASRRTRSRSGSASLQPISPRTPAGRAARRRRRAASTASGWASCVRHTRSARTGLPRKRISARGGRGPSWIDAAEARGRAPPDAPAVGTGSDARSSRAATAATSTDRRRSPSRLQPRSGTASARFASPSIVPAWPQGSRAPPASSIRISSVGTPRSCTARTPGTARRASAAARAPASSRAPESQIRARESPWRSAAGSTQSAAPSGRRERSRTSSESSRAALRSGSVPGRKRTVSSAPSVRTSPAMPRTRPSERTALSTGSTHSRATSAGSRSSPRSSPTVSSGKLCRGW